MKITRNPAWQDFQHALDSVIERAARAGLVVVGRRATPLVWRLPLQLFWIAALLWVARARLSMTTTF
jgi:hypothetical protein